MPTEHILSLLIAERDKLNRAIEALQGPAKRRGRPPKAARRVGGAKRAARSATGGGAASKFSTGQAVRYKQGGGEFEAKVVKIDADANWMTIERDLDKRRS